VVDPPLIKIWVGGYGGGQTGDGGGCGRRPRWGEKQREEQLLGTRKKDDFFLNLDPRFPLLGA